MSPGATLWLLLTLSLPPPHAAAPTPPPASPGTGPEVSWGDWLIVDEAEPGASILLRRITPKSVFIAPTVCSEGYRQDAMGRCVKVVKINQQAQWKLLLERLNSMYAPAPAAHKDKEAGPFHVSLPLGSDGSQEDTNVKKRVPPPTTTTTTTTGPPPTTTATPDLPTTTDPADPLTTTTVPEPVLADQPAEDDRSDSPHPTDKPFVIIVTNKPTTRAEETTVPTTYVPTTSTEPAEESTSDTPSTDSSTGTSTDVQRYTTTTDYEDSATSTYRPRCDRRDCDLTPSPTPEVPSATRHQVRFPDERVQSSYVKFPETGAAYVYPSWTLQEHPLIRGWPPSEHAPLGLQRQYPPPAPPPYMWAEDANIWRRRFLQRD